MCVWIGEYDKCCNVLWGVCRPNRRYINMSAFNIWEKSKRKQVRYHRKLDLLCESMASELSTCDSITRNGCECEQVLRGGLLSHRTMLTHPSLCLQIALLYSSQQGAQSLIFWPWSFGLFKTFNSWTLSNLWVFGDHWRQYGGSI